MNMGDGSKRSSSLHSAREYGDDRADARRRIPTRSPNSNASFRVPSQNLSPRIREVSRRFSCSGVALFRASGCSPLKRRPLCRLRRSHCTPAAASSGIHLFTRDAPLSCCGVAGNRAAHERLVQMAAPSQIVVGPGDRCVRYDEINSAGSPNGPGCPAHRHRPNRSASTTVRREACDRPDDGDRRSVRRASRHARRFATRYRWQLGATSPMIARHAAASCSTRSMTTCCWRQRSNTRMEQQRVDRSVGQADRRRAPGARVGRAR